MTRALLRRLGELLHVDRASLPVDPATILHAILRTRPDGSSEPIGEPLIPLLTAPAMT